MEFRERAATELKEAVPRPHAVLPIQRRLRLLPRWDRGRLANLGRAARETVKDSVNPQPGGGEGSRPRSSRVPPDRWRPLEWHPHARIPVSWNVFRPEGAFEAMTDVSAKETIEKLFRHRILHMCHDEGAIDDSVLENLLSWPGTGCGAHVGLEMAATDAAARDLSRAAGGAEGGLEVPAR